MISFLSGAIVQKDTTQLDAVQYLLPGVHRTLHGRGPATV